MSFTLTYAHLSNPNFVSGLKKIAQKETWGDPKRMYNAARIGSLIDQ